jgi:hypothetical protein
VIRRLKRSRPYVLPVGGDRSLAEKGVLARLTKHNNRSLLLRIYHQSFSGNVGMPWQSDYFQVPAFCVTHHFSR